MHARALNPAAPSKLADLLTFSKVRVNSLVVATTAAGYYIGSGHDFSMASLVVTSLATALVAAGAAGLNQVSERDVDRLMVRTRLRPVADARMSASEGVTVALLMGGLGLLMLWITAGWLAAAVALGTFVSYAFIYTPLKRTTSLSTIVGAVPGALPPLIGWAAARGTLLEPAPWALFMIGFLWQLPHIIAVGWMYREDYARAGLPVLASVDRTGAMSGRQAIVWSATLIPFSLLPAALSIAGPVYVAGALLLGLVQFVLAVRFARERSGERARQLFYATLIYLPVLWILMAVGR
jgi:protoheme IX farnesyltransferase